MDVSTRRCTCLSYRYQPGSLACGFCGGSPPLDGLVPAPPADIPCSSNLRLLALISAVAVIHCLVLILAIGGALIGVIAGALTGRSSRLGIFRGFVVGGAAGVWISFATFESLQDYWSRELDGPSLVDLAEEEGFFTIIRNRFLEGGLEPYQRQVNNDNDDKFSRRLSQDSLKKLPYHVIVEEARTEQQDDCCAICLQNVEVGETARRLPGCHHMFHLVCVDKWLVRQGSCPVCRRIVQV